MNWKLRKRRVGGELDPLSERKKKSEEEYISYINTYIKDSLDNTPPSINLAKHPNQDRNSYFK